MFKVKLIKGLSYTGAVRVTKADPVAEVEEKELAEALVASGYFELVEASDEGVNLDKMTKAQLEAYAAENGIDLTGKTSKADIIVAIKEAQSSDDDGAADYSDEE